MTGSRWVELARGLARGALPTRGLPTRGPLGVVAAVVASLAGSPAWAAAPVGTPVLRIERIDVSQPPRIRLFVTQVGQDGQVARPPAPTAVKLVVDGQPLATPELKVGTARSVGEPLAVTFVLQDSGGMEAAFAEAQRSLLEIGDALPAGSSVGLVAFTNTVRTALDPQPFADIKGELSRLTLDTDAVETQLGIGVGRGLEGLTGSKAASLPARRVLLVVAEGLTSSYERTEFTALASRAKDNGVRIHAVGYYKFGEPEQPTLALLSSLSKGTLRAYADPAGVRDGLKAVGAELADQWVLDLDQPRLFDGMRHDFQLELGSGQASEVERAVIPASTVGKTQDLGPVLYGAGAAVILVVIIAGAVVWSKKRKVEAQKVLQNLEPVVMEKTSMTDARDVRAAVSAMQAKQNTPAVVPFTAPAGDTEIPMSGRKLGALPPLPLMASEPVPETRPPISPAAAPDLMALPSPTQFLRRIDMEAEGPTLNEAEPAPAIVPVAIAPAPARRNFPPDDVTTPSFQSLPGLRLNDDYDSPIMDPASRMALSALTEDDAPAASGELALRGRPQTLDATIPPKAGGLRSAMNATLESGAMMLKTQVLMPSESTRSDAVAWLARVGNRPATIPLSSGHKIGTGTFSVDQLGRWVLRGPEGVKLLADGDVLELDGDIHILKLATRLRTSPSSKDGLILIMGGPDDGRVLSIGRGEAYVVGTHPRADVRVRGKQVASQHLGLSLEGGKLRVADLGTAEGFKVDGQQVWKAALAPGQELQVGSVRLVFQRG